jgi:hypothetical protein
MKLVNPANRRRFNIIVVGTGLAGRHSVSRTVRDVPTASPPRVASTRPRIMPMTATASGGFFTTLSKAVISAPGKPMCIAWDR